MSKRIPPTPTKLGEMLRIYRMLQKQSLREFAPQIGVSSATLMRIEAGHAFDAQTLLVIWRWLLDAPTTP